MRLDVQCGKQLLRPQRGDISVLLTARLADRDRDNDQRAGTRSMDTSCGKGQGEESIPSGRPALIECATSAAAVCQTC